MTNQSYRVICTGEIIEGKTIDEVKKHIAALYKTTTAKVELVFRGKNTVIKKNVDLNTAKKYVRVIENAGMVCRLESLAAAKKSTTNAPPKPQKAAEPRVVEIQLKSNPDPDFLPQVSQKISSSNNGMNFNKMDVPGFNYSQIIALAVFSENEKGKDRTKALFFTAGNKRPFICDINHIAFHEFPIQAGANILASFRGFLYHLCRQNPSVVIEESTFDFLSGSQPQQLDAHKVKKLSTAIGKLIESGNIAAQT